MSEPTTFAALGGPGGTVQNGTVKGALLATLGPKFGLMLVVR